MSTFRERASDWWTRYKEKSEQRRTERRARSEYKQRRSELRYELQQLKADERARRVRSSHRHAHKDPSHHIGSCDDACRRGIRPHGHGR